MDNTSFVVDISSGKYDKSLEMIVETATLRLNATKQASYKPGQTAKIVGPIRPAYLTGQMGEIIRVNETSVTIDFFQPIYGPKSRCYHKKVRIPFKNVKRATKREENKYKSTLKTVTVPHTPNIIIYYRPDKIQIKTPRPKR